MPRKAKKTTWTTPWEMSDEQRALIPEVSGNDINGLGEGQVRRPSVVYWPNDRAFDTIAHGDLIRYFYDQPNAPEVVAVRRDEKKRAPKELNPVAAHKIEDSAENWARKAKEFALTHEADVVGIARLNPEWFFEGVQPTPVPWVIVMGAAMRYDMMKSAPPTPDNPDSALEVALLYNQVDRMAGALANWIRAQGYFAEHQGGPYSGAMTLIPPALESGIGELGKHGSVINRTHGSLLRLSAVRTDMPLVPTKADDFGADDFCTNCHVCADACPPDAISHDKQVVRGAQKWYVDFDKCVPFFNDHQGCALCLAVCPWSRPGVADTLVAKMARRRARHRQDRQKDAQTPP